MSQPVDREQNIADEVRVEVARRIDLIRQNPAVLMKYDRNCDGELDPEEELVLRAVVEAEVVRDLDDAPTTQDPGEGSGDEEPAPPEWTIDREEAIPQLAQPVMEVIDERYDVIREIGAGSQGRTYLARRHEDHEYVALKELSFDHLETWKSLELFEREGQVLRELSHPAVPDFLDAFHVDVDGSPRMFLVQEFVSGESLDVSLAQGHYWTEKDLRSFSFQMLDVLEYLHTRTPPVVHRDVKPSNIIYDGEAYRLVDFGAVQLVSPDDTGGSTVVGTTGYMPPEQLAGRAAPSSDLYALGATLVHMATHTHPAKLPAERLKLVWRDRASLSHQFNAFIDKLIQPVAEDRIRNAGEARARLQTTAPPSTAVAPVEHTIPKVTRPVDSDVRLRWEDDTLVVDMSKSIVTPIAIGGMLGLGVAIMILLATWNWGLAATTVIAGVLIGVLWPNGPDEVLRVYPGGGFHFHHVDRQSHREASGHIHRLALDGSRLHLQSDAGSMIEIGQHLSPRTRRWLFGTVDAHLKGYRQ